MLAREGGKAANGRRHNGIDGREEARPVRGRWCRKWLGGRCPVETLATEACFVHPREDAGSSGRGEVVVAGAGVGVGLLSQWAAVPTSVLG